MYDYKYAGFWIRFLAALIDTVAVIIVIGVPVSLVFGSGDWSGRAADYGALELIFNYALPAAATIWFWRRFSATPGKILLKLKIVDAKTGVQPSVGQSVVRYLGYVISTLPFLLGFIWAGVDKRKQGFHDKLAGTIVVYVRD